MLKISRFLARNWNLCNFGLFLPKFGCHVNTLNSLEKSGSTFKLKPIKPHWTYEKFLDFLHETEICAILVYIFLNLVAMATPLVPLKIEHIWSRRPKNLTFHAKKSSISCTELKSTVLAPLKIIIAYWDSPVPKSQLYMRKIFRFLAENWWVHFLPKFGCHGNRPDFREILYIILEFADPENFLIMW